MALFHGEIKDKLHGFYGWVASFHSILPLWNFSISSRNTCLHDDLWIIQSSWGWWTTVATHGVALYSIPNCLSIEAQYDYDIEQSLNQVLFIHSKFSVFMHVQFFFCWLYFHGVHTAGSSPRCSKQQDCVPAIEVGSDFLASPWHPSLGLQLYL